MIADTAVAAAAVLALLGSGAWAAAPCWRCWAAAPGLRLQSHWLQLTGRDAGRGEEHEREELEEHHRAGGAGVRRHRRQAGWFGSVVEDS